MRNRSICKFLIKCSHCEHRINTDGRYLINHKADRTERQKEPFHTHAGQATGRHSLQKETGNGFENITKQLPLFILYRQTETSAGSLLRSGRL